MKEWLKPEIIESEASKRRSVDQRGSERAEGDNAQKDEGGSRTDESVERVSRIDVGIGNRGSCGGEHARDMRLRQANNAAPDISWRRVHSPAAISASATMPASKTRAAGPNHPCSIE